MGGMQTNISSQSSSAPNQSVCECIKHIYHTVRGRYTIYMLAGYGDREKKQQQQHWSILSSYAANGVRNTVARKRTEMNKGSTQEELNEWENKNGRHLHSTRCDDDSTAVVFGVSNESTHFHVKLYFPSV